MSSVDVMGLIPAPPRAKRAPAALLRRKRGQIAKAEKPLPPPAPTATTAAAAAADCHLLDRRLSSRMIALIEGPARTKNALLAPKDSNQSQHDFPVTT